MEYVCTADKDKSITFTFLRSKEVNLKGRSPGASLPFLDALAETPAALGLPSPSDPGHSQSPGPPAFSSRATPGLPGFPFLLAPKLSWPTVPPRTPPPGAGRLSHQPSQRELAAAAAAPALAPTGARPGPQSKPPYVGFRLGSAELEFPSPDCPQTSGPRYQYPPAAAPGQLQCHCFYLGRQ
nr:uncharacterized protein LOC131752784 [Kogia breviceps]